MQGVGRPQPVALITLSEIGVRSSALQVQESLAQLLAQVNAELESHERLDGIIVLSEAWSVENEMLTPTLKIRRGPIEQRYSFLLDKMAGVPVQFERDLV